MFEDLIDNGPEEKVALPDCMYLDKFDKCPHYTYPDDANSIVQCQHFGGLTAYCYREILQNV